MSEFVTLEGEFWWSRFKEPEQTPEQFAKPGHPTEYKWKTMFRPAQDSIMTIMDMLSKGVKNQLKKDDKGYFINFNRPTERRNKTGKTLEKFAPPQVFKADGVTPFTELFGNGTKGKLTLELKEFKTAYGTGRSARIHSATLTDVVPYGDGSPAAATAPAQGWNT